MRLIWPSQRGVVENLNSYVVCTLFLFVFTDKVISVLLYRIRTLAFCQYLPAVLFVWTVVDGSRQGTPAALRDPLLHPELLKNRERQQAILKGLSALRQV